MQKIFYTDEQKSIIQKLYNEGHGSPYIAKQLGMKTGNIAYYIKKHIGLRSPSQAAMKYQCNEHFFDVIDTEEKAYWLGMMYADGFVSKTKYGKTMGMSLSVVDIEHLEKLKRSLEATNPINTYECNETCYKPGTKYARIIITSKVLFDSLVKHGVVEHKTDILLPPLHVPEDLIRHFIRGYVDGDGCLAETNTEKRHCFATKILGTDKLLDYIKDFIEKNNIAKINGYYKRRPGQIVSSLELGGQKQTKMFFDLLYKDATIFLDRKYNRYLKLCKLYDSRVTSEDVA